MPPEAARLLPRIEREGGSIKEDMAHSSEHQHMNVADGNKGEGDWSCRVWADETPDALLR